jgi:uroporphyrinogen-III synthase/uroporphyrinogen III methyltransferase/synthase
MSALTLAGRRVLVTRALHQAGRFSRELSALGATAVEVPVIAIGPPESFEPLDEALKHLDRYDWLILTSSNTIERICNRASRFVVNPAKAEGLKIAAIGGATAETAISYGFRVTVVPDAYLAESLVSALCEMVRGKRLLLPRAAVARDVIPDALRAAGAEVDVVEAYRNAMPEAAPEQLRQALAEGLDAATFTSSSSATHLAEAARLAGVAWPFAGVPAVSIGPITSQTLQELDWPPAAEANPSNISGLIAAVERVLARRNSNPGNGGEDELSRSEQPL